jgi:hypothetical protein
LSQLLDNTQFSDDLNFIKTAKQQQCRTAIADCNRTSRYKIDANVGQPWMNPDYGIDCS